MGTARYGLAALLLLVAPVTGLGALGALIEARNLRQVSRDQGLALADALETSARNALLATQRLEEAIAQRLLDNARLLDRLLAQAPLSNRATPPGGAVQVTAEAGAKEVRLTIADRGRGIAPELLERIFDPYFTTKPEGTGLGLPIALRVIQAHGGTLDVRSIPGQGTAVEVHLPSRPPDEGIGRRNPRSAEVSL
jgi:nitrogen fixation/metabolism regulation signal transduction histidine kinase